MGFIVRAVENKPAMVGISETWLSETGHILQNMMNQYHIYKQDKGGGGPEGTTLLTEKCLMHTESEANLSTIFLLCTAIKPAPTCPGCGCQLTAQSTWKTERGKVKDRLQNSKLRTYTEEEGFESKKQGTTDPPTKAEILREIQDLGRHEVPGSDGLSIALFKDGGMILLRERPLRTSPPSEGSQSLFPSLRGVCVVTAPTMGILD